MRCAKFTAFLVAGLIAFSGASQFSASKADFAAAADTQYKFEYQTVNNEITISKCTGNSDELVIPSTLNGHNVTAIDDGAFENLCNLTRLTIPSTVKTIGEKAFQGCSKLEKLTIPNSVVSIGNGAFLNCSSLKSVEIGTGLKSVGIYAFGACPELSEITVSTANQSFASEQNMLLSKDKKTLVQYAGSSSSAVMPSVESVSAGAFFGRTDIKTITIPSTVLKIGDYAFSGCLNLQALTVPGNVLNLGIACFMNCTGLESVEIKENSTAIIPKQCFSMCSSLSELILTDSIQQINSEAFFACPSLKEIHIPASVNSIAKDAVGTYYDLRTSKNIAYSDVFISGSDKSQAQSYAKSCGIKFVSTDNVILGDADLSGFVDASDASFVLAEYSRTSTGAKPSFTYSQRIFGDYDKNGKIDASDASLILAEYARKATSK